MSNASPQATARPPCIPGLELRETIGEGGMSVVYRGVHLNLQRGVAVKVLRAAASEEASVPAWLRESRLMASLAHPHVVAIHDAGQAEGHYYLVLEDMAGGSLRSRMQPGRPWPLAQAAPVLDHIAAALSHIHDQGVLHLDLKPENILYTADGQIKITDFGLSTPRDDAQALLVGQYFQGTIDYAAPEQRSGLTLDARYDVFSLATLAYEMLTGRLPGRVYVPASRRNPRLPAALDDVLRRGLARDPEARYASVAQFRQVLADACRPSRSRVPVGLLSVASGLVALAAVLLATYLYKPIWPPSNLPTRLWVLYDKPDDLALFTDENGGELASGTAVAVKRVQVESPPRGLPPDLPLPFWPTPRPVLVVQSPGVWGFVHPLLDRTLGQRAVRHWPDLLRTVVPPGKNFVQAGGFDGPCLAPNHQGKLWREGDYTGGPETRRITLGRPSERPANPALLLTYLEPEPGLKQIGTYQPLADAPDPGAVLVLRYRARAQQGQGALAVYAAMPVVLPDSETGSAASRIRRFGRPLPPELNDPAADRWWYHCPAWVTPTGDWQTYVVITECPPFPTRLIHRNLVVDVSAPGQVWVDDIELFVWQPGSEP